MTVNIPPHIIELAQHVHAAKSRRFVTVADILGCVQKESGFCSYFNESDKLFKDNKAAAARIAKIEPAKIVEYCVIPNGPLEDKIGKFRCEPGYWTWSSNLKPAGRFGEQERFLLSCSFGLGQKMMRWLVANTPTLTWFSLIQKFMGDEEMQLLYCAGDLDSLMVGAGGNKPVAFTRYNEGFVLDKVTRKPLPRVTAYGKTVSSYAAAIEKQFVG
ncbi:MAG: hypothetical protein K2W95_15805 [Candidatus Obscuribacterales bacterium]|nr:hypothetical protein [Candidatus Obscuribacterales bacterium]